MYFFVNKYEKARKFEKPIRVLDINAIVTDIFKSGKYRPACEKLTPNRELQEELHSEFIKEVLENPDRFLEAFKEGHGDLFCVSTIYNIWGKRERYRITVGETSPLFVYSNTFDLPIQKDEDNNLVPLEDFFSKPTPDYECDIDYQYKKVQQVVKKEFFHEDKDRMYKARVYYYSQPIPFLKDKGEVIPCFGSPKKYSKKSGIDYMNIYMTCRRFKEYLKSKIK
jgi:hypothetical protein